MRVSLWKAAAPLILLAAAVSGCMHPVTSVPTFSSPGEKSTSWMPTEISISATATEAAKQLIPAVDQVSGEQGNAFPVYLPAPGAKQLTWDTVKPTGEVCVVSRNATDVGGVFGMRPDTATGMWSYNVEAFGRYDGREFADGVRAITQAVHGEAFEVRFVPTSFYVIDWMLIRTASGRVYAAPIRVANPGQPRPIVDGQALEIGQLRPPDAILHALVIDRSRRSGN